MIREHEQIVNKKEEPASFRGRLVNQKNQNKRERVLFALLGCKDTKGVLETQVSGWKNFWNRFGISPGEELLGLSPKKMSMRKQKTTPWHERRSGTLLLVVGEVRRRLPKKIKHTRYVHPQRRNGLLVLQLSELELPG